MAPTGRNIPKRQQDPVTILHARMGQIETISVGRGPQLTPKIQQIKIQGSGLPFALPDSAEMALNPMELRQKWL